MHALPMPQRLDQLLQDCTVKIMVPGGWGTGFFVASGLILTCDHVVRRSPQQVQVEWQNQTLDAVVEQSIPDPYDLALLRVMLVAAMNPPCVWLDEEVQPRDPLYLFGYPDEGDRQGEPRTSNCDGITGSDIAAILFNLGQVRPGMSGSPLLNQRTGKVCGMVKFTRGCSFGFRNMRFKACLTVFRVIHSSVPMSALVKPLATRSAICRSWGVSRFALNSLAINMQAIAAMPLDRSKYDIEVYGTSSE